MAALEEDWREFLIGRGAVLGAHGVEHYGDPLAEVRAAAAGDIVSDLSHLALIRAHGEDAAAFLQGQLSNDIRLVTADHSQLSAYCNPQGRMLAILRVFHRPDGYYLQLPAALAPETLLRLRRFVLRAKVVLDSIAGDLVRIGLSGSNVTAILEPLLPALPEAVDDCRDHGDVTVMRLPGLHPRFEIVGPPRPLQDLWEKLESQVRPAGAEAWAWLDIQAAIPTVYPETVEEFVPQTANLELIKGVSFTKGCYPGQEIVARVKYLGRIKQRMYPAHVQTDSRPLPGASLYDLDRPGQAVGRVVEARLSPQRGFDLLVVILLEHIGGRLRLGGLEGPAVELGQLPYAIEIDS